MRSEGPSPREAFGSGVLVGPGRPLLSAQLCASPDLAPRRSPQGREWSRLPVSDWDVMELELRDSSSSLPPNLSSP
jgi:hypothetical protein